MADNSIIYLGLCMRYEPPIIGIHYKNRQSDQKKKIYTILLRKLILNPNIEEIAEQLYQQHPHMLKKDKIPIQKISFLIRKIQKQHQIGQYYDNSQQAQEQQQTHQKPFINQKKVRKFNQNEFDEENHLNRSM